MYKHVNTRYLIAIIAVCAIVLAALKSSMRDRYFSDAVKAAFSSSAGVLDLSLAQPGEWDRVCLLPPYAMLPTTTNDEVKAQLGISEDDQTVVPLPNDDNFYEFVFMAKRHVVSIQRFSPGNEMSLMMTDRCVDGNAKLEITETIVRFSRTNDSGQ